jgi:hypothetical protein
VPDTVVQIAPAPNAISPPPPGVSDQACLTLRCDQNSGGNPDGISDRGQKTKRDKGLVERILLTVKRDPATSGLCAADVIGDFNVCVSEVFRRLR